MSSYIHCRRNSVTPHLSGDQIPDSGMCDFCWYEYCFCWSQYCLNEWYEMQTQHDQQNLRKKPGDRQSQNSLYTYI